MSTLFPNALDSFTNPAPTSPLTNPPHSGQHSNVNDAVEALEEKVGVNGSADTNSLDYKVTALQTTVAGLGGAPGYPPEGAGFLAWTGDPSFIAATTQLGSSGTLHLTRFYVPEAMTITNLHVWWNGAGTGVTASYMALYTAAGALLSQSASGGGTAVGLDTFPLGAPQAVAAGFYFAGLWFIHAGASPTALTHPAGAISANLANLGTTAPNLRFSRADTGLTTTAPANFGAQTAETRSIWVAAS